MPTTEARVDDQRGGAHLFGVLDTREKLIARLAVLAGMRPGEIFALKWKRLEAQYADIRERLYRGDIDSPKSSHSVRWAALSDGLLSAITDWRSASVDPSPEVLGFPLGTAHYAPSKGQLLEAALCSAA